MAMSQKLNKRMSSITRKSDDGINRAAVDTYTHTHTHWRALGFAAPQGPQAARDEQNGLRTKVLRIAMRGCEPQRGTPQHGPPLP